MTFGRPDLLWLLLSAVPVVVFHLVRRRRQRLRVPSLLLWERVLAREPRRFGPAVLTALLSLLLSLLAVGAVSLAAADPVRGDPAPPPRPLLLCVASSARMQGERWERAVGLVETELARKASGDPVTLLLVSERPRILAVGEKDPGRVLDTLRAAAPELVPERWDLARPAIVDALAGGGRVAAVGVCPGIPEGVSVLGVGVANAGISAFGAALDADEVDLFLRIAGRPETVVISLAGEEVLSLPSEAEMRIRVPRGDGGLLTVRLEPALGPWFDDVAEAWIPPDRPLRVGVVGDGAADPFLVAALEAAGRIVDVEGSGAVRAEDLDKVAGVFDVLVMAAPTAPDPLSPGNWILLTPPPVALGLTPLPVAESSPIWQRALAHPVTRDVDAAEVQVLGAVPARLDEGAEPLLAVPGGAVAAAGEKAGVRFVWIGIGAGNSTLPVTGAWPLLVRNALRWFASLAESPLAPAYAMGEEIAPPVRLPAGTRAVSLEGPGDAAGTVLDVVDGRFAYRPDSTTEGEVRLQFGDFVHRTRVNALLPGETGAEPRAGRPEFGEDRSGHTDARQSLWRWFAAAAALFLLLEWALHRLSR